MTKIKVLVTGATGFIGRNIIEKLCKRKDLEIFAGYFKTPPPLHHLPKSSVHWIYADLTNPIAVNEAVKGVDVIIQAAAVTSGAKDIVMRPYVHVTDNAIMNALLFRAAFEHSVKHLIFFSCTTMYPSSGKPVKEGDFDHQITDKYFGSGWTKVYNEKMCEFYSRISPTKYTVIRHSNIYGPHDKFDLERSHVFGATITKVLTAKNGKLTVWGDGSEKRDFLYVDDLISFVELIMKKQKDKFDIINLGSGLGVSVTALANEIMAASGKALKLVYDLTKPTIGFDLVLNTNKAKAKYGWKQKIKLREGIRRTLQWCSSNVPT